MITFRWILYRVSAVVLVVVCGACSNGRSPNGSDESTVPNEVFRGDFGATMLLTGDIVAEDAVPLVAPNVNVWPLQVRWLVEDGTEVEEGDVVVEFDNSQLVSNLDERRVRVIEAENRLAATEAEGIASVEEARLTVDRCSATLEKARIDASAPAGMRSKVEEERFRLAFDKARLELREAERILEDKQRIAESNLDIQGIAVQRERAEVSKAVEGSQRLTLRASRSGIVILRRNHQEDRLFQSGDTTYPGSVIATLPDLQTLLVEARLFDVDDGRIAAGQWVEATLDTFPGTAYSGTVRDIAPFAKETGRMSLRRGSRTVIDLDDPDTELMLPGMSVKVTVRAPALTGVLLMPRPCIRWLEAVPHAVLAGGGEVAVELGPCNHQVCVVESGLEEGVRLDPADHSLSSGEVGAST